MKRKRTPRASRPQTIRLDPDALRVVANISGATGWSANQTVNRLVVVGWLSMRGSPKEGELLAERVAAAAAIHDARCLATKQMTSLRQTERKIAEKMRPPHITEIPKAPKH